MRSERSPISRISNKIVSSTAVDATTIKKILLKLKLIFNVYIYAEQLFKLGKL